MEELSEEENTVNSLRKEYEDNHDNYAMYGYAVTSSYADWLESKLISTRNQLNDLKEIMKGE